jgi:autotransporter-associated beta strand protein
VHLDGSNPSLAAITVDGSADYTIAQGSGGTLQFQGAGNSGSLIDANDNLAISAPLSLASNLEVSPASGITVTVSGGIIGNGASLTQDGPGTLILSGVNTYTGGTTILGGTLVVTAGNALASGSLNIEGGGLVLNAPLMSVAGLFGASTTGPVAANSATGSSSAVQAAPATASQASQASTVSEGGTSLSTAKGVVSRPATPFVPHPTCHPN